MNTKQSFFRTWLPEAKDFLLTFGVVFGILWATGQMYETAKSNEALRLRVDQLESQLNEAHPAAPQTDAGLILPLERSEPKNTNKGLDSNLLMK
jgi:hypothetical protein